MRLAFINELIAQATQDKNIYLMTGDLGYGIFEPFKEQLPQQYINAGVAEQNMVGVATGLALSGKTVFIYSIANFPTLRCLEQIRNDICYHQANVKVVSVGCGYSYGLQGYTHFGIEDISILRSLPHIKIVSPADPMETRLAVRDMVRHPGPGYLRLGNTREKQLHQNEQEESLLSTLLPVHVTKSETVVLATGVITTYVAEKLKELQLDYQLWSVPVIKPLDKEKLALIARSSKKIFTVEEHQLAGGFGSAICEALLDLKCAKIIDELPQINRIGIDEVAIKDIGNQEYLRKKIDFSSLFQKERIVA